MITHTITIFELIWTVVALCGLGFMLGVLHRAYKDREWIIKEHANGYHELRKSVSVTSILIFLGGCITQLSYVLVGIIAMTQPSPGGRIHVTSIINSIIFVIASITGTVFAGAIYVRRVRVVQEIAERIRSGH